MAKNRENGLKYKLKTA
ncbi:hypothetical protein F383_11808 [Gossypium arboreum]|uniref:Uncharacterized protein n=1 Tax=Gossypium arboreum TaxID=29729 RepID=A0A0B0Q071_GOSAR|nr:hypothetical protein F383_11808 [Gossypium arboreum]